MANSELVGKVGWRQAISAGVKAAMQMRFPGAGGGSYGTSGAWMVDNNFTRNVLSSIGRFWGSGINWQQRAGDPTLSSLVMSAVNWLGSTLPEAPLVVMEMSKDGKETPNYLHPSLKIFNRPNPFYTGATLRKAFAASWITRGNAYWVKVRNARGQVIQLWDAPAWMMCARWPATSSNTFVEYYDYEVEGRHSRFEIEDVVHFRNGLSDDGRHGRSFLDPIYREISKDNQESNYGALLAENGAVPPVVLSLDGKFDDDDDVKAYKDKYQATTQGDERGKVFVSNQRVEVIKLGFSPSDMDLRSAHRFNEERFAAVIGIDAIVLGLGSGQDASTYNNTEQADRRTTRRFLKPLWEYLEDDLTQQLGADLGLKENERFAFDLSRVSALQEDQDALFKRATNAYMVGKWAKRSEVREMAGMKVTPEDEVYYDDVQPQPKAQLMPGNKPATAKDRQMPDEEAKRLPWIKSKYDFSSTQVNLPADLAEMVLEMGRIYPEADYIEDGHEDNPHITILYGLHTQKAADVEPVLADVPPIRATMGVTDYFVGPDYDVVYVSVESEDLHKLNASLKAELSHTDTHAGYTPHVTIAYLKSGKGQQYAGDAFLEGVEVVFDEVTFSSKNGVKTKFKLTGESGQKKKSLSHSTKSYSFDDIELAREPHDFELKTLKAVVGAQDAAFDQVSPVLLAARLNLIEQGLAQLAERDWPELSLPPALTTKLNTAIRWSLRRGRLTLNKDEQKSDLVAAMAELAQRITGAATLALGTQIGARMTAELSRWLLRGYSREDAVREVEKALAAETFPYIDEIAAGSAYEAVGKGRDYELRKLIKEGARFIYSAILDKNTCDVCRGVDLVESDDPGDLPEAPNPECLGRWRCRCMIVVAYDGEREPGPDPVQPAPQPDAPAKPKKPRSKPKPTRPETGAQARERLAELGKDAEAKVAKLDAEVMALHREYYQTDAKGRRKVDRQISKLTAQVGQVRSQLPAIYREVLYVDPERSATFDYTVAPKTGAVIKGKAEQGIKAFQRLVGVDSLKGKTVTVGTATKGRAYALGDGIYMSSRNGIGTYVHELAHWLEGNDAAIHQKVLDFYERRTAGDKLEKLRDLTGKTYGRHEVAKKDKWLNTYMGKYYENRAGQQFATEILSMGLELFYDDPVKLANEDPEYFDFIFEVVRGK